MKYTVNDLAHSKGVTPLVREALLAMEAKLNREWVGLTDDEVSNIIDVEIGFNSCFGPEENFARAIEAKLKEKNA